jgi:hypothetical protein
MLNVSARTVAAAKVGGEARRILLDLGNADQTDAAASTVASAPMVLAPVTVILMA